MQKFTKIVAALLLVISLALPNVALHASAAEQWTQYPTKNTGDVNKSWKITLSQPVDSKTVTNQNVYVEKVNGTKVDVQVSVNGATITVKPKVAYTFGETYTLYLLSSIQSVNEQSLPNTKFQFNVLGALEIANSVSQEAQNAAAAINTEQPVFANPLAGTKDELTRANVLVGNLERAIASAQEKVNAAQALIIAASKAGVTVKELVGANNLVTNAKKAIAIAEAAVTVAKQAIETASITAQLPVASVVVTSYSTLQVTLAESPTYELTKSDVSKFRVNVDGEIVQVSDVVKETSDDKRYTLTIATTATKNPLFGKQGSLSVNNKKASIKNSEYGYDFKAPTIESVEVIDSHHIKVNFSENMSESAASVGSYDVYKSTATTTDLLSGSGTVGVLSADRKSATLTLSTSNALVAASYTLKVTGTINDVASNSLKANTTVDFSATDSQLVDKTRPSLTTADYDSSTGVLNVTFDEKVTIVSLSQFTLGGVSLIGASSTSSNEETKHKITLTSTVKADVDKKITNPLRLTISAGGVKDAATSPNYNILTNFDVAVVIPPKAIEASYSEYSKRLRVTFDQSIQMANVDKAKISVVFKDSNLMPISYTLTGGKIQSVGNGTTLSIELTKDDSKEIEENAGDSVTGTVNLAAGAVKNTTDQQTANVEQSNIPLTYSQDTGKPSVEAVTVQSVPNRNNDTIEVEFTEPMEESTAMNLANYVFENGTPSKSVPLTTANATIKLSDDLKKVTITLKGIDLQTGSAFSLQVSNIIDLTGEMLDTEKRTGKVTGDLTAPFLKSVSGSTSDTQDIVIVHFSEAVKKDSAEKIENYTIESPTGSDISTKLPVGLTPKLTYTEVDTNNDGAVDEFIVEIKYSKSTPLEILESGGTVTVSALAVVDLAGNEMVSGTAAEGIVSDGVAPTITSVQGKTVQGGLDEIIVTFSENVDPKTAVINTNYTLEVAEKPVSLTNLKANDFSVSNNIVTLKLDTSSTKDGYDVDDYALKNDLLNTKSLKLTVNNVKDIKGNVISPPNNTLEGSVDHTDNDIIADLFETTVTNAKVTGANTVQFTWNEELDPTTLQPSDFSFLDGTTDYQITSVELDTKTKKTVTLTTKKSIPFKNGNLKLSITGEFTDLAGNAIPANNSVLVTPLGTATEYALTGKKVSDVVTQAPKYISKGIDKRISDLFQLETGITNNGEGFVVDTITFNVTTNTLFLDELQLMWSDDALVGNDLKVSVPKQNVADGDLKFSAINKEIASGEDGYFYVIAKVSSPGTATISLQGATAKGSQTKVNVESTDVILGTEVTIDTTAPVVTFKSSTLNTIVVHVDEVSSLASTRSNAILKDTTELKTIFEVGGANTENITIKTAKYNFTTKAITIETSAGLPSNEFIRIKAGELQDEAGNPLAATYIAQGNGTDKPYVDPYELNTVDDHIGDIIQNAIGSGALAYGPNTATIKQITGNVTITGDASGPITLRNLDITGDLIIDTPNASIILANTVTVRRNIIINRVSSFVNNGTITGEVKINTDSLVKLGGIILQANVLKPAKLQVENGATIHTLTVNNPMEVTVTNNGAITTLAGTGIVFVNGTDALGYTDTIHANTALAAINRASTVVAIGEALIKYAANTALGLDLTAYKTLGVGSSYQTAVHTAVFNSGNDYTTTSDIKMVFDNAVTAQIAQADVDKEAQKIAKTLSVTTNGKETFPMLSSASNYEIKVNTTSKEDVYDKNGIGKKAGISLVDYTVTHKATGKTAITSKITVNVTPAVTGVNASFKVTQGVAEVAAKAPAPVTLAGLTFTASAGATLNGYKFRLGDVADGTVAGATLSGKIVTIAGDFSNSDLAGTYAVASDIQAAVRSSDASLVSVTVGGTAVATTTGSESTEFTGGVAAVPATTEIFTITVTATGVVTAGTVRFTVGGLYYDVLVTDGMTVDAIASALHAKMNNVTGYTASVSTNVVTLTANTGGNQTDLTGSISNQ